MKFVCLYSVSRFPNGGGGETDDIAAREPGLPFSAFYRTRFGGVHSCVCRTCSLFNFYRGFLTHVYNYNVSIAPATRSSSSNALLSSYATACIDYTHTHTRATARRDDDRRLLHNV